MKRASVGGRALTLALVALVSMSGARAAELEIRKDAAGRPVIAARTAPEDVVILEKTEDWGQWDAWVTGHGPLRGVTDLGNGGASAFYRARVRERGPEDDWKNVIAGDPGEPFQSELLDPLSPAPRWVKFALMLEPPRRVVFQDSGRYDFHYDFAIARLPEFAGMTRQEFDAVTLRTNAQKAALGAVLFGPPTAPNEIAIQFVGHDVYPKEDIARWFEEARAMVMAPPGTQFFYLPTFEQADLAQRESEWFAARGIRVVSASRWVSGNTCYATGWALGKLTFIEATDIEAAYREGRLTPTDVLLTDAVPAEVPPVAGIVSLAPGTPNSHVAILARSFGIPFVFIAGEEAAAELMSWNGRDALVRAATEYGGCVVSVGALATPLEESLREELIALKTPPPLKLNPKEHLGKISVEVDGLRPEDIRHVGGKAANMGVLRRSIPTNSPSPAIAFTFDLWDGYLDQARPGGITLREELEDALGNFAWPPDVNALKQTLESLRDVVEDRADFSPAQKAEILSALQAAGFDPMRKIRFRSSTNVEDSEQFTGAGLYDSYSGCLADDLDNDNAGPSHCDPSEERERGVFRALRKVYASFYNDNAVLERLRHRVDETQVGMAVLAHYSTPDEIEMANGVATLSIRTGPGERTAEAQLVTQLGAVSVTNPDTSVAPEVVKATFHTAGIPYFNVTQHSALVPLGATVLDWPEDYEKLFELLQAASREWERDAGERERWILDFEYKKVAPDGELRLKQIRPLPLPDDGMAPREWILNATNRWVLEQGEHGTLLGHHRLKSAWVLSTRHARLDETSLTQTLLASVEGAWLEGTNLVSASGPISAFPGHTHERAGGETRDTWQTSDGTRTLAVELAGFARAEQGPIALLSDFKLKFQARYDTPQLTLEWFGEGGPTARQTQEEMAHLKILPPVGPGSLLQERVMRDGNREARTKFYWPPPPTGAVGGYTAPLQAWVETILEGFTSEPIVLRGDHSQTYRPGHHNFWEEFLFDPWMEPGIDPATLEELKAANIRGVVGSIDSQGQTSLFIWGLDGSFRGIE